MEKKNIYSILVFALCLAFINCTNNNEADTILKNDSSVLKVYLNEENNVTVNGEKVLLENLDYYLSSRKNKVSKIYYSRYNSQSPEAPKEVITVIQIIAKQNLPISLFTDSTFNTVVEN
ncbi:hypothetical protein ESA94_09805 [Lacibacter luteus]|uniref:Uncharacterized protein n=1 Tax=Lacibacter luteus TaxID=2508719 RepID=A0A4Q1CK46_9BACT|nr:hypothetical protein [Lacibacter luteus]RXK60748.1 hypothetical protein ESA94_09805 [Lacibacter luteus]